MSEPFAVIPIFVNAGAAVLPALFAAAASVLSLLLRPRELLRACRRRPGAALAVVGSGAAVALAIALLWSQPGAAGAVRPDDASPRPDWAQIAAEILRRRQSASTGLSPPPAPNGQSAATVFRRDYTRGGHDGGPAPLALRPAWEYRPEDTMFLSSPAVVASPHGVRVYGAACQLDVTGKYGAIVCLDAATGKRLWETSSADADGQQPLKPFFSSPAVTADGRRLVIGQGLHDDADCALLCLETDSGKIRWQVPTPLHLESSPAIFGDLVVVGAGAIEDADRKPQSDPGFVVAVRISDGTTLWRYALADPESSPAIDEEGIVYIGSGFNGASVAALRSESEEELKAKELPRLKWRSGAPYAITGAVTLVGELVLVGGGNGDYVFGSPNPAGCVLALDRRTGVVRWQREMEDAVLGAIAARGQVQPGGRGLAICPVRNGEVVALDLADGGMLWRKRISGKTPVLAGCALAYPYVYAVSRDGYLAVLDARDGKVLEKHLLNQEGKPGELGLSLSSPTVAAGRVFVGSETGGLKCFAGSKPPPANR